MEMRKGSESNRFPTEFRDPAPRVDNNVSPELQSASWRSQVNHLGVGSEVLARVRELILKAQYGPGAKLPSERDIAAQLSVGRPAVREAIKALCMLDVLESRRGAGTFVRSLSGLSGDWPVQLKTGDLEFDMLELLEVRRMMEPPAAAFAAARATQAQLHEIRRSLEAQEMRPDDRHINSEEDHVFHDAIIRAAGNRVLYDISRILSPLLIKSRSMTGASAIDFERMLRMHRLIYEAIRRGDPETARSSMLDHLNVVGMDLLATPRHIVDKSSGTSDAAARRGSRGGSRRTHSSRIDRG